ncbi:MAG: hypothetical protein GC161_06815 [Planctomycetaceae bacterium]|nr:hypothetical protein [Planctomycetaceae bacterium]
MNISKLLAAAIATTAVLALTSLLLHLTPRASAEWTSCASSSTGDWAISGPDGDRSDQLVSNNSSANVTVTVSNQSNPGPNTTVKIIIGDSVGQAADGTIEAGDSGTFTVPPGKKLWVKVSNGSTVAEGEYEIISCP